MSFINAWRRVQEEKAKRKKWRKACSSDTQEIDVSELRGLLKQCDPVVAASPSGD